MLTAGLVCAWTLVAGVVWRVTGTFYIDPQSWTVHATPGAVVGIVLLYLFGVYQAPDF